MSFPVQAVSTNATAIVLLFSLLLNFRTKYRRGKNDTRIFFYMLIINIIQCVIEPITIVIDGKMFTHAAALSLILNSCLFVNNIIFAYLWSLYADYHIKGGEKNKRDCLIKFAPAAVIIILCTVNLFTPVFFSITSENVYKRSPMFLLTYIITYAYLIRGTVAAYSSKRRPRRYVFLPALTFLGPVFIASIVQFLFPGVSMLWAGSAIGLASAYISLLDEGASIDILSGAYTRYHMTNSLRGLPRSSADGKTVAGVMLDINKFKSINDTFGHPVGDDAIRSVGHILHKATNKNDMIFRYGGDEFLIITLADGEADISVLIDRINSEARFFNETEGKPYRIDFSVGYAIRGEDEKTGDFLKRIDDAMYKNKNEPKQK